jgi:hypothetical protein
VVAVVLERSLAPLARGHPAFAPREPLRGDGAEGGPRPEGQDAVVGGLAQEFAFDPRLLEVARDRPQARSAVDDHADGMPAVRVAVDASLNADTPPRLTASLRLRPSLFALRSPTIRPALRAGCEGLSVGGGVRRPRAPALRRARHRRSTWRTSDGTRTAAIARADYREGRRRLIRGDVGSLRRSSESSAALGGSSGPDFIGTATRSSGRRIPDLSRR